MMRENRLPFSKRIPPYFLVVGTAWLSRALSIGIRLLTISLLLRFLGIEQYALFAILISLESWFLLCDFGMGASVQNFLTEALSQGKEIEKVLVSTAQISLLFLFGSLGILLIFSQKIERWVFPETHAGGKWILLTGSLYMLVAIGTIAHRCLYALQKGYWVHVLQAIANLFSLFFFFFLERHYKGEEKIFVCLLAMVGVSAFFSVWIFCRTLMSRAVFSSFCKEEFSKILKRSSRFWLFSLLGAGVLSVDYLIMSKTLSKENIVSYHILSRIFYVLFFIYNAFLHAIWPTFTEKWIKKEWEELSSLLKRYTAVGVLLLLCCTGGLLLFSQSICDILFPEKKMLFSHSTLILFGLYMMIRVIIDTYAMALQSISHLKMFFFLIPLQALIGGVGQYILSLKYGIDGIVLGLILSYLCTVFWGIPLQFYKLRRKDYSWRRAF